MPAGTVAPSGLAAQGFNETKNHTPLHISRALATLTESAERAHAFRLNAPLKQIGKNEMPTLNTLSNPTVYAKATAADIHSYKRTVKTVSQMHMGRIFAPWQ